MHKIIVISFVALLGLTAPVAAQPPSAAQAQIPATEDKAQTAEALEGATSTTAAAPDDVPQSVKDACRGDYEKFCSQHEPGSAEVRVCMAGAFEKLSDTCVTAILDSPLADQAAEQVEAAREAATEAQPDSAASGEGAVSPRFKRATRTARVHPSYSQKMTQQSKRTPYAKVSVRLNRARPAAHKNVRYAAYRARKSKVRRSVTGYIRRGTSIANYYVAKYTRVGLTRAFR